MPYHQVMRFHAMAAKSPEKIIGNGSISGEVNLSCTVLAMVFATLWSLKMKKATKLKSAAQMTALTGERTFVETTVAMELAASWKPLMKSKAKARKMTMMRRVMERRRLSGLFHDDGLEYVGYVLAFVGGCFKSGEHLFDFYHLHGVLLVFK